MSEELRSFLIATLGLDVLLALALLLTLTRGHVRATDERLGAASRRAWLAVVFQAGHFAEELATGFHTRFPELLGLSAFPMSIFVVFNVVWILLFAFAAAGIRCANRLALFPLWFLGLASVFNGFAHPAFSAVSGGYFPGLFSSPFVAGAGFLLVRCLLEVTEAGVRRDT